MKSGKKDINHELNRGVRGVVANSQNHSEQMKVILIDDNGMCHDYFQSCREDGEVDGWIDKVAMWYAEVGSSE